MAAYRRPCRCEHGITLHRDHLADTARDGRQTDRNTSCTRCTCGEFVDAAAQADTLAGAERIIESEGTQT